MSQAVHSATSAATEALKAAPAVGIALTGATGTIDWPVVSYALVSLYTLLQIVLLLPKYRGWLKSWRS